jgi:hypothetical protein
VGANIGARAAGLSEVQESLLGPAKKEMNSQTPLTFAIVLMAVIAAFSLWILFTEG